MRIMITILLALLLSACQDKSKDKAQTPDTNQTFVAGDPRAHVVGNVNLSASMLDVNQSFEKLIWKEGDTILAEGETFHSSDLPVGAHTITLIMIDKAGESHEKSINITVKAPTITNTPPKATSFDIQTQEDTRSPVHALLGSDADGDHLTYVMLAKPQHGTLSGSYARLTYTPKANYFGADTFSYKTNDGIVDSEVATVTIMISGENDAPTAQDDTYTIDENQQTSFNILDNDHDIDTNKTQFSFTLQQPTEGVLLQTSKNGDIIFQAPNYEDNDTHTITFGYTLYDNVADNNLSSQATIELTVQGKADKKPFIMRVDINNSASLDFTIPIDNTRRDYHYSVDCNSDGLYEVVGTNTSYTCQYPETGEYNISIFGDFPHIKFGDNNLNNSKKLHAIQQWGQIEWKSMQKAFQGCTNLTSLPADAPNLQNVKDMSEMFAAKSIEIPMKKTTSPMKLKADLNHWDVSHVENMSAMFFNAQDFNSSLKDWNVSNVSTMQKMFYNALSFESNISAWDVSKVNTMQRMFEKATHFNANISRWEVSNLLDMSHMFENAKNFNQDLNDWDVSKVTNMVHTFRFADKFNQPLDRWDIANVRNTIGMFDGALLFNQDISDWNVSRLPYMDDMLLNANSFSRTNYDKLLNKWSQLSLQDGVTFGTGTNLTYTELDAHNRLTNDFHWKITDGGLDPTKIDDIAFITTWETTADNYSITIPTQNGFTYNYTVVWGDGENNTSVTGDITHSYSNEGNHTVKIFGLFPSIINAKYPIQPKQLRSVNHWGTQKWKTMLGAFQYCKNLEINATDIPDLSAVTSLQSMFNSATNFNSDISSWDVRTIKNMSEMFYNTDKFDQNISGWDVSNVENMSYMFKNASAFNQNLGDWNISSATSMNTIFDDSNLSNKNYTSTLDGWLKSGVKDNVSFGAESKQVTDPTSRDALINNHGWHIDDAGFNHPPVARIYPDKEMDTLTAPQTITFSASNSSDSDGNITSYLWKVNDQTTSTDMNFTHTFMTPGEHLVTLTITDNQGKTSSETVTNTLKSIFIQTATIKTNTNGEISMLEIGDLDKDGDLDILVNARDKQVLWYENRGDDTYESHSIAISVSSKTVHIADINRDGFSDILYAGNSLTICTNKQDKTFDCKQTIHSGIRSDDDISSITVNDIDNDSDIDILTTSYSENTVNIFTNDANGAFTYDEELSNNLEGKALGGTLLKATSLDSSQKHDLIVAGEGGGIHFHQYNADGSFTNTVSFTADTPTSVSFAMLDPDSESDIIATTKKGELFWYSKTQDKKHPIENLSKPIPYAFGVDIDGDGHTDILTNTNASDGAIMWFKNDGKANPSFSKHIIAANANDITITQARDIDNDGDDDIISADGAGNIHIYTNNSATKEVKIIAPTSSGDFTRDGATQTVKDQTTGLTWADDTPAQANWVDATSYCRDLGDDWRLPTVQELYFISIKNSTEPSISTVFTNKKSEMYWSSTNNAANNTQAWTVKFNLAFDFNDRNKEPQPKEEVPYVRCVQGKTLKTIFIRDDAKKVVLDKQHKLMWQDDASVIDNSSTKKWEDAVDHCEKLDFAGHNTGWRLPNIHELYTIADRSKHHPAFQDAFKSINSGEYWSSTASSYLTGRKISIKFIDGSDGMPSSSNTLSVRCVRGISE